MHILSQIPRKEKTLNSTVSERTDDFYRRKAYAIRLMVCMLLQEHQRVFPGPVISLTEGLEQRVLRV